MARMALYQSNMNHVNNRLMCVGQSGTQHPVLIFSIGRMMFQQNDALHQVQIYSIRRPLGVHSQLFESNNAVDSPFDCLERNPHGPWLVASQSHDPYEWLEHTGNTYDLNPVAVHRIQLNTQFQLDPNLFIKSMETLRNNVGSNWRDKNEKSESFTVDQKYEPKQR